MRPLFVCLAGLVFTVGAHAEGIDYLRDVKPVLAKHCYACHGAEKQKAGLRLDPAAAARKGGNSGPAVVPGKAGDSLLILAVTGAGDLKRMPPREPFLDARQVALLRSWIDQG